LLDWRVIFFYTPLIYTKLHGFCEKRRVSFFCMLLGVFGVNRDLPPLWFLHRISIRLLIGSKYDGLALVIVRGNLLMNGLKLFWLERRGFY